MSVGSLLKKIGIVILNLFFLCFVITSCKDRCHDVICMNNGTCKKGKCDCNNGFYGEHCEYYDSCYEVKCLNGGVCDEGICDCADGYTGDDCATALIPTSVVITKINLLIFPSTKNGLSWDDASGPDVFLTLNKGHNADMTDFITPNYTDHFAPLVFDSSYGLPYTIIKPDANYTIGAWDDEGTGAPEWMDEKTFIALDQSTGFPLTIHLTWPGWDCYLYVEWKF